MAVEVTNMERRLVLVAEALLVAGLMGSAAQAHQLGCWIQADRNVKVRIATARYATEARAALSEWDSFTILNFTYVSSGEETYVTSASSGLTGWGGATTFTIGPDNCTILRATVQLNTYYSYTSNEIRGIFCQEAGHTFGLDHSNDGGCMGGGYWYSMSNHYRVVSHNVNDIGSMYANRVVGAHAEHPTIGTETDEPRIHAFWINNPRSLRETTRLATDIVVATVTAVTDGDSIVNRLSDGSVSRIPTQRVYLNVKRSRKGEMVAGESLVLFQNGNDANRFAEDPSYKVGGRYLLFLTPRPDGTYLVVSPEGRYELSSRGLVPAASQGWAADLKGANLQDVMLDVTKALVEGSE